MLLNTLMLSPKLAIFLLASVVIVCDSVANETVVCKLITTRLQ